jgi:hypothetical protein
MSVYSHGQKQCAIGCLGTEATAWGYIYFEWCNLLPAYTVKRRLICRASSTTEGSDPTPLKYRSNGRTEAVDSDVTELPPKYSETRGGHRDDSNFGNNEENHKMTIRVDALNW